MPEIEKIPVEPVEPGKEESLNASEIKAVPETVHDEFEIQDQTGLKNDAIASPEANLPVATTPEVKPVAHILVKGVVDARQQVEEVGGKTNPDFSQSKSSQDNLIRFQEDQIENQHPNE